MKRFNPLKTNKQMTKSKEEILDKNYPLITIKPLSKLQRVCIVDAMEEYATQEIKSLDSLNQKQLQKYIEDLSAKDKTISDLTLLVGELRGENRIVRGANFNCVSENIELRGLVKNIEAWLCFNKHPSLVQINDLKQDLEKRISMFSLLGKDEDE